MSLTDNKTRSGACRSCGYLNDQHSATCVPGRKFRLEPSRRAPRDARISATVRANHRMQEWLAGNC